MKLSPWFYPSEPPVRAGRYQVKDWIGRITEVDWDGAHFQRAGLRIDITTIRCWRGVVR
jgi:hypothetical protein